MPRLDELNAFFGADLVTDLVAAPVGKEMSRPFEYREPSPYSEEAAISRRLSEFAADIREAKMIADRRAYADELALAPANAHGFWGS